MNLFYDADEENMLPPLPFFYHVLKYLRSNVKRF
jgi:hypothetical protein